MWRMHLTPPAAVYILYVHQMSGELDCLSNLTSSTALPRARPHTAFTASWASCWPKDTSPWLLKCLRWYKQHLQLPARNLDCFIMGLKTVQHWWCLSRLSWSLGMMTQVWTLHAMLGFYYISHEASLYIFGQSLTVTSLLYWSLSIVLETGFQTIPKRLCQRWM